MYEGKNDNVNVNNRRARQLRTFEIYIHFILKETMNRIFTLVFFRLLCVVRQDGFPAAAARRPDGSARTAAAHLTAAAAAPAEPAAGL